MLKFCVVLWTTISMIDLPWPQIAFTFESNGPLKTAFGDLKCLLYLQAYYGQRVNVPPYFNSAVASGHAPHPYMWGPPQVGAP